MEESRNVFNARLRGGRMAGGGACVSLVGLRWLERLRDLRMKIALSGGPPCRRRLCLAIPGHRLSNCGENLQLSDPFLELERLDSLTLLLSFALFSHFCPSFDAICTLQDLSVLFPWPSVLHPCSRHSASTLQEPGLLSSNFWARFQR